MATVFSGIIFPAEQQNTASTPLESSSQDFFDERYLVVGRFALWQHSNACLDLVKKMLTRVYFLQSFCFLYN